MKKLQPAVFLIIVCTTLYSPFSYAEITLKFGLYSSDKASDMVRKFRPILNVLQQELTQILSEPVTIRLKVASSYDKGIANLVNGQVDFARFGPASYIISKQQNSKIKILANERNKKTKKTSGVLVVNENSEINSITGLVGKSFAFGNENSTLGRYFAQDSLYNNGVTASELSEYKYLGRHDRVAAAVYSGQFDAGSFKVKTLNKFAKKGKNFKVLTHYPIIFKVWLARENLDIRIFNAIQSSLINLQGEHRTELNHAGFVLAFDKDFELVKQVIEKNYLFFEK